MSPLKLLVVGDLILDTYYVSDELSAPGEGPTVFAKNARKVKRPGGAGRVAWAAKEMGAEVEFLSAHYCDTDAIGMFGDALPELDVHQFRGATHGSDVDRKIRLVAGGRVVTRIDTRFIPCEVSYNRDDIDLQRSYLDGIRVENYDAAIFSDYAKGTFLGGFGHLLAGVARELSERMPVIVAPKDIGLWPGIPFTIVMNRAEAEVAIGIAHSPDNDVEELARLVWRDLNGRFVVVTDGAKGAGVCLDGETDTFRPDIGWVGHDATGAGDVFVAALALYQARGHPPGDAVQGAVRVASLSVSRPDVTTVVHPDANDLFRPGGAANLA